MYMYMIVGQNSQRSAIAGSSTPGLHFSPTPSQSTMPPYKDPRTNRVSDSLEGLTKTTWQDAELAVFGIISSFTTAMTNESCRTNFSVGHNHVGNIKEPRLKCTWFVPHVQLSRVAPRHINLNQSCHTNTGTYDKQVHARHARVAGPVKKIQTSHMRHVRTHTVATLWFKEVTTKSKSW